MLVVLVVLVVLLVLLVVAVVVVVRTCVLHEGVCPAKRTVAPNYGGRVPVDTTPGPAPVCRALKNLPIIPAVEADSWNRSLRHHNDVHNRR